MVVNIRDFNNETNLKIKKVVFKKNISIEGTSAHIKRGSVINIENKPFIVLQIITAESHTFLNKVLTKYQLIVQDATVNISELKNLDYKAYSKVRYLITDNLNYTTRGTNNNFLNVKIINKKENICYQLIQKIVDIVSVQYVDTKLKIGYQVELEPIFYQEEINNLLIRENSSHLKLITRV